MNLVIMGPPGAGKGTQATMICTKYSIPHISTGDIFRYHISAKTPLGIKADEYISKGQLVPDDITIEIIKDRLSKEDSFSGFLLDGFPRTVAQAEALHNYLSSEGKRIDLVICLNLPDEEVLKRMTGRRVCPNCGASYHIEFNPPKIEGKCDLCGNYVVQREDDSLDTVVKRLKVYSHETQPLIKYYREKKILALIDGTVGINKVFGNISEILGSEK